jgi:UDP-N-acetyl-2-amino-2-deoxyglucuronate dehydrogenase
LTGFTAGRKILIKSFLYLKSDLMSPRVYNISIAGCGKVAHLHARAIQCIANARLAAVWSRSPSSAEGFAIKYNTRAYSDITAMVKENNIDLVIICTPHPFHKQPAIEAANAGANVLVEKPLAANLPDCDEIIGACSAVLSTITMLGWRDKAYYDSDAWRGTWEEEGGGVLVNQAPHQLDLLLWYMGEIDELYGIWRNLNHPYIAVEDTAAAIIKFRSGAIGNILVSNSQKPGLYGKVHVHGENGASVGVQTDGGAMFIAGMTGVTEPPVNDLWTIPGEENLLKEWVRLDTETFNNCDPTIKYMQYQIEDYLLSLDKGKEPSVTGEDGRRTVELFTAIYKSSLDNKPVKFPLDAIR